MKIVWLCPFPINSITNINNFIKTKLPQSHPSSWIVNLADEIKKNESTELNIVTVSSRINEIIEIKSDHNYYIIPNGLTFIKKGYPSFLPVDRLFGYRSLFYKIQKIIFKIKPDLIHAHGTEGPYGLTAVKFKNKHLISIQGIVNYLKIYEHGITSTIQSKLEIKTIQSALNFGCRTDWDKKFVHDLNPNARIFHMPEAINYNFINSSWNGIQSNNILIVGSICKRKGTEFLIQCIPSITKHFPKAKFIFVGSGNNNYIMKMKKLSKKLSIENSVNWLGVKDSSNIAKLLSNARLYILPTYIDNSPNSLLEAMGVGTPSIAARVGGIPSMVKDETLIRLFDMDNKDEFISKVLDLLSDNDLSINISNRSKQFVQKNNNPELVAKITLDVYNQILTA